ncbi:hypothetical protein DPMN_079869, partial [Dreissena polymorpha]
MIVDSLTQRAVRTSTQSGQELRSPQQSHASFGDIINCAIVNKRKTFWLFAQDCRGFTIALNSRPLKLQLAATDCRSVKLADNTTSKFQTHPPKQFDTGGPPASLPSAAKVGSSSLV